MKSVAANQVSCPSSHQMKPFMPKNLPPAIVRSVELDGAEGGLRARRVNTEDLVVLTEPLEDVVDLNVDARVPDQEIVGLRQFAGLAVDQSSVIPALRLHDPGLLRREGSRWGLDVASRSRLGRLSLANY